MVGPLFLYSTSPSPHEPTILTWAGRHQPDRSRPLAAVVVQTALIDPSPAEVAPHFGRYDIKPWLRAFPECTDLGIPDGAMALVLRGREVEPVGSQPLPFVSG